MYIYIYNNLIDIWVSKNMVPENPLVYNNVLYSLPIFRETQNRDATVWSVSANKTVSALILFSCHSRLSQNGKETAGYGVCLKVWHHKIQ